MSKEKTITRRDFLKGVVVGALATAGGAYGINNLRQSNNRHSINTPSEQNTDQEQHAEEENLHAAGLEKFMGTFYALQELHNAYRATPKFSDNFEDPFIYDDILLPASFGARDTAPIKLLAGGWEQDSDDPSEAAKKRLEAINFSGTDNQEFYRQALMPFADTVPAFILAAPDEIVIRDTEGGGYAGGHYTDIATPRIPNHFTVSAFHELSHGLEGNWEALKGHYPQDALANYIQIKAEVIKDTLDHYFALPWEQAQTFYDGKLFFYTPPTVYENQLEDIEEMVHAWEDVLGYERYSDDEDLDKDTNRPYYLAKATHRVGKMLSNIAQKDSTLVTDDEEALQNDRRVTRLMQQVVNDLDHYFVGPVQIGDVGLPTTEDEIHAKDTPLTQANMIVQKAKLQSFSTLPEDSQNAEDLKAVLYPDIDSLVANYTDNAEQGAEVDEIFAKYGLEDFLHVYEISGIFLEEYSTWPYRLSGMTPPMITYLFALAQDGDAKLAARLTNGWSERENTLTQDVEEKIKNLSIDTSETGDDAEEIRDAIHRASTHLGKLVMALPDNIKMTNEVDIDVDSVISSVTDAGTQTATLTTPQIHSDNEALSKPFYHSLSVVLNRSLEENWHLARPYLTTEDTAEYLERKLILIYELAEWYINLSFSEAINARDGGHLHKNLFQEEQEIKLEVAQTQIKGEDFLTREELKSMIGVDAKEELPVQTYYEYVAQYVTRKLFESSHKDPSERTQEEEDLRSNPALIQFAEGVLNTIDTYLSLPVSVKNSLPLSFDTLALSGEFGFEEARMIMQEERIDIFADRDGLSGDPIEDWAKAVGATD